MNIQEVFKEHISEQDRKINAKSEAG